MDPKQETLEMLNDPTMWSGDGSVLPLIRYVERQQLPEFAFVHKEPSGAFSLYRGNIFAIADGSQPRPEPVPYASAEAIVQEGWEVD